MSVTFLFQILPCPAAIPLLNRIIGFLKSWICRTGSDSMRVPPRQYLGPYVEIWLLIFFMMLKRYIYILVFYGYTQILWQISEVLWPDDWVPLAYH